MKTKATKGRPFGWILVGLSAVCVYLAVQIREEFRMTSDGRIIVDYEFVQHGARKRAIFTAAEWVLGMLPERLRSLRKDDLVAEARLRCGSDSLWTHPYADQALTALTDAYVTDKPALTNVGRMMTRENLIGYLCTQIKVTKLLKEKPEILKEVVKPIIIAGGPRTGSTHMLSMLCSHPNATCLTFSEALDPVSPVSSPEQILTWRDPRLWKGYAAKLILEGLQPLFKYMFRFGPTSPMEEIQLGSQVFGSSMFLTTVHLPSYGKWFRATDHTPMEEYSKILLQILQHQRGLKNKLWILKSPQNADQLGPKMNVFPDAKVVLMHREAWPVLNSLVGMLSYGVTSFNHFEQVDFRAFARFWVDHQRWSMVECLDPKRVAQLVKPISRVMNIRFDEYMKDPVEMAMKVVAHAGLPTGPEARAAIQDFHINSPRDGSNVLFYDLASYGISKSQIDEMYALYEKNYLKD